MELASMSSISGKLVEYYCKKKEKVERKNMHTPLLVTVTLR